MKSAYILGMDLAGPANAAGTAAALLRPEGTRLSLIELRRGLDDAGLYHWMEGAVPPGAALVVGLDAPLSYNPGGGDRPADRALRERLTAAGLAAGTVMTPTMTRMAYLTLRGMAVARLITAGWDSARIAEVHPGGALVLRGAAPGLVKDLKRRAAARAGLLEWLAEQGFAGLPTRASDHEVAAVAAALAAHHWSRGRPVWNHPAAPPLHPYPVIC